MLYANEEALHIETSRYAVPHPIIMSVKGG